MAIEFCICSTLKNNFRLVYLRSKGTFSYEPIAKINELESHRLNTLAIERSGSVKSNT